ncbi:MAG: hypothetical protein DRN96_09710 [Thermoproteota archaeon]|nr:MAG: hypothetical protein DRN96_09710 [Candidatus Korarchaeota archaeon]
MVSLRRERGEHYRSERRRRSDQVRPEGALSHPQGLRGEAPEDSGAQEDPPEEIQEAHGGVRQAERNRARDFLHKLTTRIVGELASLNYGIILEDLNGIKKRTARKGKANKKIRRRLSKWDARMFQFMLAYKAAWAGLPVRFVNPAHSSRTCPVCSGRLKAYQGRLMRCEGCSLIIDRDEAAALNLRMRGAWGSPEGGIYGDDAQGRRLSTDDVSRTHLLSAWRRLPQLPRHLPQLPAQLPSYPEARCHSSVASSLPS